MASENKNENVMLTGQSAYFKKSGSMTNHGTIELENALSSHSYSEGYIGPNSVLHGTDLAETTEYTQCETIMKNYLGDNWEENENERTIITNSNKIKSMLEPGETNMQKLKDNITFDGTELEYIRSTGTQYIDTGVLGNNNIKYVIELSNITSSTSEETAIFGSGYYSSNTALLTKDTNNVLTWYYNNSKVTVTDSISSKNIIELYRGSIKVNDTVIASSTAINTNANFKNITLFNVANSHYASYYLYSFKMYDNDVLIRDFIPCKDVNNVVCLYDKITKTYFYNKGSEMFTAGPQLDTKHTELEYIETDGTQRIDLGLRAVSNSGFYIDFMPLEDFSTTESSGKKCIIAAGGNGVRSMFITTQPYINVCSKPNYAKGSIQIGRNATPLDAKLVQYQRTQIELKNNILTLGNGDKITTEQGNPPSYAYWRLFNFYSAFGSVDAKAKVRFYGCKIYEGDTVVRDVIPVKDKFGIGCIYDKITDKLLYADINSDKIKLGPIKK